MRGRVTAAAALAVTAALLLSGCSGDDSGWDLASSLTGGSSTPAPPKPNGTAAHPYPADSPPDSGNDYNASWIALPDGRLVLCVRIKTPGFTGSPSLSCDFEHARDAPVK